MGDPIDPDKLVSLAEIGRKFGYNASYVSRLATSGKVRAWRVGKTWATTKELFEEYVKNNPGPGTPSHKHKRRSKKKSK